MENETGCGIVPYVYKDRNLVNAVQWAVGLELLLLIDDPWRIFLTTDHPNGGCFWRYPEIIRLLMDVEFRKEEVKKLPAKAQKRIVLADLDRQYTLSEIVDHHLGGPGALARPDTERTSGGRRRRGRDDLSGEAGRRPSVHLSALRDQGRGDRGRGGRVRAVTEGREFIVHPACDEKIEEYLRPMFEKVYTISFENYPVDLERLRRPEYGRAGDASGTVGTRAGIGSG